MTMHVYEEQIRPCPRCKKTASFRHVSKNGHSLFFVGCKPCGLWSMGSEQVEKVMWRWNKRASGATTMGVKCFFCGSPTQEVKGGKWPSLHCSNCGATLDPARPEDLPQES